MESPVWTPSGSTFSIEHTAMHVSSASRITSYSISCQPTRHCSTMTWPIGLDRRPLRMRSRYCSSVSTMPPPVPPSVNAGGTMAGRPMAASAVSAEEARSWAVSPRTMADGGDGWPVRAGGGGRGVGGGGGGKDSLGPFRRDHRFDGLDRERLEVDRIGDLRVGHDRGRVRVHPGRSGTLGAPR